MNRGARETTLEFAERYTKRLAEIDRSQSPFRKIAGWLVFAYAILVINIRVGPVVKAAKRPAV